MALRGEDGRAPLTTKRFLGVVWRGSVLCVDEVEEGGRAGGGGTGGGLAAAGDGGLNTSLARGAAGTGVGVADRPSRGLGEAYPVLAVYAEFANPCNGLCGAGEGDGVQPAFAGGGKTEVYTGAAGGCSGTGEGENEARLRDVVCPDAAGGGARGPLGWCWCWCFGGTGGGEPVPDLSPRLGMAYCGGRDIVMGYSK